MNLEHIVFSPSGQICQFYRPKYVCLFALISLHLRYSSIALVFTLSKLSPHTVKPSQCAVTALSATLRWFHSLFLLMLQSEECQCIQDI